MEIKEINTAELVKMLDEYFTDSTAVDLKLLAEWINDQRMTGFEKHRFYYHVIYNHAWKKFPTLAKIVDYFVAFRPADAPKDNALAENNRQEIARWSRFTTKRIMEILVDINKKDANQWKFGDICFMNKYGRLYTEMRYLQAHKFDREAIRMKIEKYRQNIEDGIRIVAEDGDIKIDESQLVPFAEVK